MEFSLDPSNVIRFGMTLLNGEDMAAKDKIKKWVKMSLEQLVL